MKKNLIAVLGLALFLSAAAPGFSQAGFYLGGFGGVSAQKPSLEGVNFDSNTTFLYGLRAGVQILAFALEFNYYKAGHNVSMSDFYLFNWDGLESDLSFIGGNLRVMFPLTIFRPFLALGYGFYTSNLKSIDKDTQGGFNFGAGLEVKLGKLALIGEGKFNRVKVTLDEVKVALGHFTLTAGLSVYF